MKMPPLQPLPLVFTATEADVHKLMQKYGALCRKMALEEAAKLCDEVQEMYGQYTFSARVSAERIRELLNC